MSVGSNNTVHFTNSVHIPFCKHGRPMSRADHIYDKVCSTSDIEMSSTSPNYENMAPAPRRSTNHESYGVYRSRSKDRISVMSYRVAIRWSIVIVTLTLINIGLSSWIAANVLMIKAQLDKTGTFTSFRIRPDRCSHAVNNEVILHKLQAIMKDTAYNIPRLINSHIDHFTEHANNATNFLAPIEVEVEMIIDDELQAFGSTRLKQSTTGKILISRKGVNVTKETHHFKLKRKCIEGNDYPECKTDTDEDDYDQGPTPPPTTKHPSHVPRGPPAVSRELRSPGINKFRVNYISCAIRSLYIDAISKRLDEIKQTLHENHPCRAV